MKVDHPHHVLSSMLQATAVPSDLGSTTVPGTHTNPNPAEFVSMFAGININNSVFQFSQNPVHGMPSSMTANTDNDHQAPKLKRRRQYLPNLHKFIQNSDFLYINMILLDVLHFQSDVFHSDSGWSDRSDLCEFGIFARRAMVDQAR